MTVIESAMIVLILSRLFCEQSGFLQASACSNARAARYAMNRPPSASTTSTNSDGFALASIFLQHPVLAG
jgi:hypothetical protein